MEGIIVNHRSVDCLHNQVVCQQFGSKSLFPLHKDVEPFLQQMVWMDYSRHGSTYVVGHLIM